MNALIGGAISHPKRQQGSKVQTVDSLIRCIRQRAATHHRQLDWKCRGGYTAPDEILAYVKLLLQTFEDTGMQSQDT